ncbi:MAG TPA: VTT domain-containing protein, partial [Patescibacteria group bacterium]
KKEYQIGFLIFLLSAVILYFAGKQISNETIQNFVTTTGPLAPIAYIFLHALSYILAPVTGFPFLIAGFYLFGKTAVIYIYLTAILGSTLNFLIAKKWGRPLVEKLAGKESLEKVDKTANEYGLLALFMIRLFLVGLADIISYAYGLTGIKYFTFILISSIAMIPSHVIWYFAASKVENIEQFLSLSVGLTFIASGIFVLGNYLLRRRFV